MASTLIAWLTIKSSPPCLPTVATLKQKEPPAIMPRTTLGPESAQYSNTFLRAAKPRLRLVMHLRVPQRIVTRIWPSQGRSRWSAPGPSYLLAQDNGGGYKM